MYPRAADLSSAEVRGYSDRELFWIVKNGIRLSGMPAFGKVESDQHIWSLVHHLRSLNPPIRKSAGMDLEVTVVVATFASTGASRALLAWGHMIE